jgi:hypothetical protein
MSRARTDGSPLRRKLSRLEGRLPNSALDELSDRELWALQRDLIDAALEADLPPTDVQSRVRGWARNFHVGGADDLPARVLWSRVRPRVDRQAGGIELDWLSPRMQAILAEGA